MKYDKAALEACRGFAARDGAVDLAAAKSTWALIADGAVKKQTRADGRVVKSSVTNVELATALYVLETFAWADDAQAWFRERGRGRRREVIGFIEGKKKKARTNEASSRTDDRK